MSRESIHNHGVDLLYTYLVRIFETPAGHPTHILYIIFTDFVKCCGLRYILDLVFQYRKHSGQYNNRVAGALRFISESAPPDIVWTPVLKLPAEGIPKPLTAKLCVGEDTKHPDHCQSRR